MGFCEGIIYGEPGQLLFAPGHPQRVGLMSVNILNWLFLSRIVFIFLWFRPLYLYLVKLGFVFQTDWDQLSEPSDALGHQLTANGVIGDCLHCLWWWWWLWWWRWCQRWWCWWFWWWWLVMMVMMVIVRMMIWDSIKDTFLMSSMLEPGGNLNTGGDS